MCFWLVGNCFGWDSYEIKLGVDEGIELGFRIDILRAALM